MCCVMPPTSPLATRLRRMVSSRVVLPWSTWPNMVTTGGRVTSLEGSTTSASSREAAALGVAPSSGLTPYAEGRGNEGGHLEIDDLVQRHHDPVAHELFDGVDGAYSWSARPGASPSWSVGQHHRLGRGLALPLPLRPAVWPPPPGSAVLRSSSQISNLGWLEPPLPVG